MEVSLMQELTWPEVREITESSSTALIPVGSTEQHGPHAPLGTDLFIPEFIASSVARKKNILCTPAIPVGVYWS